MSIRRTTSNGASTHAPPGRGGRDETTRFAADTFAAGTFADEREIELPRDGLIDGPQSWVYDEAENRLHVQKAVMALTM